MPFLLSWNRRRHHSSPSTRDSHPEASPSPPLHSPTDHSCGTPSAIQNFRLRWVDKKCQECAVCYNKFQMNCIITLLPCGHYYCQGCMDQWFYSCNSATCPLCRYDCSQPQKNGGDFDAVPVSCDSSTDGSSSEEQEDSDGYYCCYRDRAFTAKEWEDPSSGASEPDQLSILLEKYSHRTNFHLILTKALKAKQARERQAEENTVSG